MPQSREQMLRNLAKARAVRKANLRKRVRRNPDDMTADMDYGIAPSGLKPVGGKSKSPRRTSKQVAKALKAKVKDTRERLSSLSPKQQVLVKELAGMGGQVKNLLSKGRTSGALTAALKKVIAERKAILRARETLKRTRRPVAEQGEDKGRRMKSYTVRFYVSNGGDVTHVGNDMHYFTVRAAATDAKSIVRQAVGPDSPIYEGGYEGWLDGGEATNKAIETAQALGIDLTGGSKLLPEAPVKLQEAALEAVEDNADEALLRSNPKKAYTSEEIDRKRALARKRFKAVIHRKAKDGKPASRASMGIGAQWENVRQTNNKNKMFLHPKLYVSQKKDGQGIIAVISEDSVDRRPAQVKSLSQAASGSGIVVKPAKAPKPPKAPKK